MNLDDDGEEAISTTVGNSLFPAGSLIVANNGGVIVGGLGQLPAVNTPLPSNFFDSALLPFWDDLISTTGGVYWEERLVSNVETLIVQWDDRSHFAHGDGITFQLQVFGSGNVAARFAYQDVEFGFNDINFGNSATVGFQADSQSYLEFSHNMPTLANGDVIDLLGSSGMFDTDEFSIDLTAAAGSILDVVVTGLDRSFADQGLELLDPNGGVVAIGSNSPLGVTGDGYDLAIVDFTIVQGGIYTVRFSSLLAGNYSVVVTRDTVFDLEPNNEPGQSRRTISQDIDALGMLGGNAVQFKQFQDPSLFVDISNTGTLLSLGDDGSATVTTTIGNALIPAGEVSIGNNGGVVQGGNQLVPLSNVALPSGFAGAALFPFWDDIDSDDGGVYWQETDVDGVPTLIVQWDQRPHFPNTGSATFQMQLFATGSTAARFVYPDIEFGNAAFDFGASATIGYQRDQTEADQFSLNNPSLANGDVVELIIAQRDEYLIDLVANQTALFDVSNVLADPSHHPANDLDVQLAVVDLSGTVLASTTNSTLVFNAPQSGTYVLQIEDESGVGEYAVDTSIVQMSGDFIPDGVIDCLDVDLLTAEILAGTHNPALDLNGDGNVDYGDLEVWVLQLKGTLFGDANLDGVVDAIDFTIWNENRFSGGGWCQGDFNADGIVDAIDFTTWNSNRFQTALNLDTAILRPIEIGSRVLFDSYHEPHQSQPLPTVVLPVQLGFDRREPVVQRLSETDAVDRFSAIRQIFAERDGSEDDWGWI